MILCIGTTPTVQRTLVFDRLMPDEVNRAVVVDEYASGKSVNVARVASLIGAQSLATGFAGGDRGDFLRQQLSSEGVRHDFQVIQPQTRLCTTVIDRAAESVTELVEEHAAVAREGWLGLRRRFARLLRKHSPSVCVISGSLPPQADLSFYPDIITLAVKSGTQVVLDTRGTPLQRSLRCKGFVAKLNREELSQTVGRAIRSDRQLKRAMREIAPEAGSVIVTMGKEGAVVWDGAKFWRISTPSVTAVNPIGSGDAFAAGLAVGLERGLPAGQIYALASACGAANALNPRAGVVKRADVQRLRKAVSVDPFSSAAN